MARQRSSLALAVLFQFSLVATTEVATAQSSEIIAAEQACANAENGTDNAAAVTACTKALSLAPNNAKMALYLCASHASAGNFDAAVTSCTRAIALDAKSETAYVDRCDANLVLGNLANAISDCTQAIALDPTDALPHLNLGDVYLKQSNFAASLAESTKAIALAPNSAGAIANRGIANAALGNTDAAIADFKSALKIDPTFASALNGLARLGQPVAANPATTPPPKAAQPAAALTREISVCNDFSVTIYAGFAIESQGHYTAGGWWNVDPNKCAPANFNIGNAAAVYYTADSASYQKANVATTDHWGSETNLYVVDQKFNFADAERNQNGRHAEKFTALTLSPDDQAKNLVLTFRFGNTGTDIKITATKP
jgi:tetratricopeptide (TPR) repeat protein